MRQSILFVLLLSCGMVSAQNWALLNPDYKYNYSNDGTDTISNQIFVTHIDTLGVDSFRYEMNRIAVVCDTCPASLGGPCDGCFVRIDQPQFLGYECIQSGTDWMFNGAGTFLVKSSASIGDPWTFDETAGTIATVDTTWADQSFGVPDTLQRILISSGDTLLLSRSFGILRFDKSANHIDLLGVQGANVGRLFPDPLAYFDYQPGDELTYAINAVWWATPEGGPQFPQPTHCYWTAVIIGRTETPDTVNYTISFARTYYNSNYPGWVSEEPNWPIPIGQWSFNRTDVISAHPILSAYPGQVLDYSICWLYGELFPYIATSGINADGRNTMYAQPLAQVPDGANGAFNLQAQVAPGVYPMVEYPIVRVNYEEGLGIRKVESITQNNMGLKTSVELVGAIIGGDTIIEPPVINWSVGVEEQSLNAFQIFPNPTSDQVVIQFEHPEASTWRILDLSGRVALRGKWASDLQYMIDVSSLQTGTYLIELESVNGRSTQQLVIAR